MKNRKIRKKEEITAPWPSLDQSRALRTEDPA